MKNCIKNWNLLNWDHILRLYITLKLYDFMIMILPLFNLFNEVFFINYKNLSFKYINNNNNYILLKYIKYYIRDFF